MIRIRRKSPNIKNNRELGCCLAGKNTTQVQFPERIFFKKLCAVCVCNPNIPKTKFKMDTGDSPRVPWPS